MLCNLPGQHAHYVPSPSIGMYKIYHGSLEQTWDDNDPVVRFGPEHAWLLDAVAITDDGIVRGAVEDGGMTIPGDVLFVGYGEADVFHHYC